MANKKVIDEKQKIAKKMLQSIARDSSEDVWQFKQLIDDITSENPFLKSNQLKAEVIKRAMKVGYDDLTAERLYRTCANAVIPFLNSGEKIARADGVLDKIVEICSKELYQPVFDKDGQEITKKFDPKVADNIIKAVKVKLDTLVRVQANIVNATRTDTGKTSDSNTLDLSEADREELEKFVASELIDNPDITSKLINAKSFEDPSWNEDLNLTIGDIKPVNE